MAIPSAHIRQWEHNRALLGLIPRTHPDWIVTVCFYTALHAVDALLAADKVANITSHEARNLVLMRTNRYQAINRKYHPLYSLSRTVRYMADPAHWIPAERIEGDILARYLYPLEQSVQHLMKTRLELGEIMLARDAD